MRLGTIACNTQHLAVYLRYVGLSPSDMRKRKTETECCPKS